MRTFEQLGDLGVFPVFARAALVLAAIGLAFRGLSIRGRTTVGVASYLFIASLLLVMLGRDAINLILEILPTAALKQRTVLATRYGAVPQIALLLAAAGIIDGVQRGRTRVIATALTCAGLLAWAPEFHIARLPNRDWPLWAGRLEQKLASGSREPLIIPLNPPPFRITFDSPQPAAVP
jgi:hypothetical protein